MPFALDSDYVPGRTKMKGRRVQRPPRPDGGDDAELEEEGEAVP